MKHERGAAFLVVMWLLALLAIVLGAFVLLARSERLQARHLFEGTRARLAAEAGVHRAGYALSLPDPTQRWIADGRSYTFEFDGAEVEVAITDESGKIDLNAADPSVMSRFFQGSGLAMDQADALAAAIVDWRDPDDLVSLNGAELDDYEAAGRNYGPKNANFDLVSEVLQVLGMDYELYLRTESAMTVYSGLPMPNPAFAPAAALGALEGMDGALAESIVNARHGWDPNGGADPVLLPDGNPLMVSAGSGTYSIVSRARLPNGVWSELDTVIRIGGNPASGTAFSVLRWQDGSML